MDNSANFKVNLEFLGLGNANKAEQSLKAVAEACIDLTGLTEPLAKITKVLESIDSTLLKIGGDAKKSAGHLEKMRADSALGLGKLVSIEDKVAQGLKNIGQKAKEAGEDVRKSFVDSLSMDAFSFNNIVGAVQNVAGMVAPIFEEGMMRETAGVQFGTLLKGEHRDGNEYAEKLRDTDAASLYGTGTINQAAMKMISFGFDSDTTLKTLQQLGDIAMGDKGKLDSMATAFGQITSAGKMMTEDFNQLRDAGFNPLRVISDATGESMQSLKDKMEKGQVSAQMVAESLEMATSGSGKFNGMMKSVMENTLQGKMAKLQGMFDNLKTKIFELILPIANTLLPVITDRLMPAFMDAVDFMSPVFDLIADNLDTVGLFVGVLGSLSAAMGVVNAVMSANPVSLVIIGIAGLVSVIYKAVKAYDDWGAAVLFLMGPIGMVTNLAMTLYRYWNAIFDADNWVDGLKMFGVAILDFVLTPMKQILGMIGNLTGAEWAKKAMQGVEDFRRKIGAIDPEKKSEPSAAGGEDEGFMAGLLSAASVGGDTGGGVGGGNALAAATGKGNEAVASGGTRSTNVTITVEKVVEQMNFNGGLEESTDELSQRLEFIVGNILYGASRYMRG